MFTYKEGLDTISIPFQVFQGFFNIGDCGVLPLPPRYHCQKQEDQCVLTITAKLGSKKRVRNAVSVKGSLIVPGLFLLGVLGNLLDSLEYMSS